VTWQREPCSIKAIQCPPRRRQSADLETFRRIYLYCSALGVHTEVGNAPVRRVSVVWFGKAELLRTMDSESDCIRVSIQTQWADTVQHRTIPTLSFIIIIVVTMYRRETCAARWSMSNQHATLWGHASLPNPRASGNTTSEKAHLEGSCRVTTD